jgi:hypothetical protein
MAACGGAGRDGTFSEEDVAPHLLRMAKDPKARGLVQVANPFGEMPVAHRQKQIKEIGVNEREEPYSASNLLPVCPPSHRRSQPACTLPGTGDPVRRRK